MGHCDFDVVPREWCLCKVLGWMGRQSLVGSGETVQLDLAGLSAVFLDGCKGMAGYVWNA